MAAIIVLAPAGAPARAQDYPQRSIRVIVPFSPGTSPDILARGLTPAMTAELGQGLVVIDREGASGAIGFAEVANAAPDGYTLVLGPQGPLTVQPRLKANPAYELGSFAPVCQLYEDAFALFVGPNSPITDLTGLIARAKAQPLSFGSPGIATVPHLQVESLMRSAGFSMKHAPYRAVGQMIQDVVGGNLDLAIGSIASIRGSAGRVLAVMGETKSAVYPDAPTTREAGYAVSKTSFIGILAPRGVPAAVSARLESACAKAATSADFQKLERDSGAVPLYLGAHDYAARLAEDNVEKGGLIKALDLKE